MKKKAVGKRDAAASAKRSVKSKPAKKSAAKRDAKVAKKAGAKSAAKAPPRLKHGIGQVPDIIPGKYADGMPYNQVKYVECKLILRPNHFTSRQSFFDFAKLMKRPARETGVGFSTGEFVNAPLQIREVLFLDTPDFRFYNNAFILRRRIPYQDGFPVGDPEIVFKFRHPDLQQCASTDVRPDVPGEYRIKFKAEVLPLKDELGGLRMLYSHNVELSLSSLGHEEDRTSLAALPQIFPPLAALKKHANEKVELVSDTIVEEVLQDIGTLDFGDGVTAKCNVALWRARGNHRPLVGEFGFQLKIGRDGKLNDRSMKRAEAFFLALQNEARDWIALGVTKTAVVYRLKGNPPKAHE
jgi:hypothetical protein